MNNKYLLTYTNFMYYQKLEKLTNLSKDYEVVFLCVGNPKVWYDSFGPMFGSLLKHFNLNKFIYGDLKAPITSENINYYIDCIYKFHVKPFVVVIDSAISSDCFGVTKINDCGLDIACLSDRSTHVGDMSISYTIGKNDVSNYQKFSEMLKDIKNVARMINFIFKDDYYKYAK